MRYGNLTIKVVKSINPQARDMYRINTAYNSKPTSRDKIYFSGDIAECNLLSTINHVLSVIKHDSANIVVSTVFAQPVISYDTISQLQQLAPVSIH